MVRPTHNGRGAHGGLEWLGPRRDDRPAVRQRGLVLRASSSARRAARRFTGTGRSLRCRRTLRHHGPPACPRRHCRGPNAQLSSVSTLASRRCAPVVNSWISGTPSQARAIRSTIPTIGSRFGHCRILLPTFRATHPTRHGVRVEPGGSNKRMDVSGALLESVYVGGPLADWTRRTMRRVMRKRPRQSAR